MTPDFLTGTLDRQERSSVPRIALAQRIRDAVASTRRNYSTMKRQNRVAHFLKDHAALVAAALSFCALLVSAATFYRSFLYRAESLTSSILSERFGAGDEYQFQLGLFNHGNRNAILMSVELQLWSDRDFRVLKGHQPAGMWKILPSQLSQALPLTIKGGESQLLDLSVNVGAPRLRAYLRGMDNPDTSLPATLGIMTSAADSQGHVYYSTRPATIFLIQVPANPGVDILSMTSAGIYPDAAELFSSYTAPAPKNLWRVRQRK